MMSVASMTIYSGPIVIERTAMDIENTDPVCCSKSIRYRPVKQQKHDSIWAFRYCRMHASFCCWVRNLWRHGSPANPIKSALGVQNKWLHLATHYIGWRENLKIFRLAQEYSEGKPARAPYWTEKNDESESQEVHNRQRNLLTCTFGRGKWHVSGGRA